MLHIRTRCHAFMSSEQAASSVEYAVLLGLVTVSTAVGLAVLGGDVRNAATSATAGLAPGGTGTGSTAGTTGPAQRTVFGDRFTSAAATKSNWDFNSSAWQANGNALNVGPTSGTLIAYAKGSTFADGTVSVTATVTAGWGIGVLFHLSGDPVTQNVNGYSFQYDIGYGTGGFLLRKWVNGVELSTPLAITYPPAGYQWYGVQRNLQVTTQGANITCMVDGVTVISISDSSYLSGGAGLRLWNNPTATFNSFQVTTSGN